MRRPGEMLGKAFGLIAVAERFQPRQMLAVERRFAADREADAMHRQREALAQRAQLRMRRPARAHVVFGMDFDEADRLPAGQDVGKCCGLKPMPARAGRRDVISMVARIAHGRMRGARRGAGRAPRCREGRLHLALSEPMPFGVFI